MISAAGTGSIVCAVRGGPGSHYTRRAALERAGVTARLLYILVTVPAEAYEPLHEGEQRAIRAELAWRELALARANAAQLGNPDAQFNIQIRIGELGAVVADFAVEVEASLVMLGAPRRAPDASLTAESLEALAGSLRSRLDIEVEIVAPPTTDGQVGR